MFETGHGERVDSFRGLVTKDLVRRPDTTIALMLSAAELNTIYETAIRMRIFDYSEPHPAIEIGGLRVPNTEVRLWLKAGASEKLIRWDTGWRHKGSASDEWKRLYVLVRLIRETVEKRAEYRSLPPPEGGYR